MIDIIKQGTKEYRALEVAAAMLTFESPKGYSYDVEETYFDFGQDWEWTTIVANKTAGCSYQALYPREHERIINAETVEEIAEVVRQILADKYCPDTAD